LSFRDEQIFNLLGEPLKELQTHLHVPHFYDPTERVVKSAAFHGHNSSGKSNFFKSYKLFIELVLNSFMGNKNVDPITVQPFLLNTASSQKPIHFEITFLVRNVKYRYAFEILEGKIVSEWLYYAESKTRENNLFLRINQDIKISKSWNKEAGGKIENQALPFAKENILLLSILLSQIDIPKIDPIRVWLNHQVFIPTFGENTLLLLKKAISIYTNPDYKNRILYFIDKADLGFKTVFDKIGGSNLLKKYGEGFANFFHDDEISRFELYTQHTVYDDKYTIVSNRLFEMIKDESDGSIKFFIMSCLFAQSIRNGDITWADELDARLHPELFELLVKIFHEPNLNSNGAQLFFTTHNTVLLNKKLRRDQVYLVDKNEYGESNIKRLHTKESPVRIDSPIEKDYRKGEFGGISKKVKKLNDLPSLFDEEE
jgi:uncharacterized protein